MATPSGNIKKDTSRQSAGSLFRAEFMSESFVKVWSDKVKNDTGELRSDKQYQNNFIVIIIIIIISNGVTSNYFVEVDGVLNLIYQKCNTSQY